MRALSPLERGRQLLAESKRGVQEKASKGYADARLFTKLALSWRFRFLFCDLRLNCSLGFLSLSKWVKPVFASSRSEG